MKKIFIIIILFGILFPLNAQTFGWVNTAGGSNSDAGGTTLIDRSENIYICGKIMFPNASFDTQTVVVNGFSDGFLAKYDSSGSLLWVNSYGGNDGFATGDGNSSIIFDSDTSSIFMCGSFIGACYIGSYHLVAHSGTDRDAFIAKLDLNGNCIWAKSFGGYGSDGAYIMSLDGSGNFFVNLSFEFSAVVDTFNVPNGKYLGCFDTLGNFLWVKSFTTNTSIGTIKPWGPDYILAGGMSAFTFSIDTFSYNLPGYAGKFLTRLDSNFHVKWAMIFGGPDQWAGPELCQSESGDLIFCGVSEGPYTTFGSDTVYSAKLFTLYLARYDQSGNKKWIRTFESNRTIIHGNNIIVDDFENIYFTGSFGDTIDFGNGFLTISDSADLPELFIVKFDSTGLCQDVAHFGWADGYAMTRTNNGTIYFTGQFREPCAVGDTQLTSYGGYDIIVGKLLSFDNLSYLNPTPDKLHIYANPTTGKCNIQIPEEFLGESNLIFNIYSLSGKLIQQQTLSSTENGILLNIEQEAKGIYLATLSNGKKMFTGKIVFE